MKPKELPVEYLSSADDVIQYIEAEDAPDWSVHHPYIPVDVGGTLVAKRANKTIKRTWYADKPLNVVETDAWWLNAEHTLLAIRCSWKVKQVPLWWQKNGGYVWYFERVNGVWEQRKLSGKRVKELLEAYRVLRMFE